ncbi:hypothetical protein [Pseudomonas sp. Irchel s3b5]|uniref:hypothetical protein n=1 Tax=Pseudomonas sp. Irchel s3b5 TaxID=2009077 RepID=UPI000BA36689|nr:hypothetical protein [Pseudomonas sp. Irchel s3b5]
MLAENSNVTIKKCEKKDVDKSDNLELKAALSLIEEQRNYLAELEQRMDAAETALVRIESELEIFKLSSAKIEKKMIVSPENILVSKKNVLNNFNQSIGLDLTARRKLLSKAIPQQLSTTSIDSKQKGILGNVRYKMAKVTRGILVVITKAAVQNTILLAAARKILIRFPKIYSKLKIFAFRRGLISPVKGAKSAGLFGSDGGNDILFEGFFPGRTPLSPRAKNIYTEVIERMPKQEGH